LEAREGFQAFLEESGLAFFLCLYFGDFGLGHGKGQFGVSLENSQEGSLFGGFLRDVDAS
jgi:hypothetical protein